MKYQGFQLSPLAVAAVVALLGAGPASAALVLSASSTASANGVAAVPSSSSSPGHESSSSSAYDQAGSGYGRSFANEYGAYYVGSSANGKGSATAFASFLNTYTNNSGVAQHYTLSFYIYGGSISTQLNSPAPLVAGESLSASYGASVKVNGGLVFSSGASILRTDTGLTYSKTGTDLNAFDDGSDGYYAWGGGYYTIDLGVFADGASFTVEAAVEDDAFADVGTYSFSGCGGYGGYGDGGYGGYGGNCTGFKGASYASYGDPMEPFGSGPGFADPTGVPTNGVPEPGSLALVGLALAGAAGAHRRRRQH